MSYTISVSTATGAGQTIGVTTGDAVVGDLIGTIQQQLRGIVKQLNDGVTINISITSSTASGSALITHRTNISSADGTTAPAANNANWASNTNSKSKVRMFITVTFSGGSTPSISFRPYLRTGGESGRVSGTDATTYTAGSWVSDIQVDGDDVLGWVESISGSPSSTDVDLSISWR